MSLDILRPFQHDGFKAWLKAMNNSGGSLVCVVNFGDKNSHHYGDPNLGMKIFENLIKKQNKVAWIGFKMHQN